MTLPELITKHHLPCAYFADRLGIANGTFCNKLKGNRGAYFNLREQKELMKIIKEMNADFTKVLNNKNNLPYVNLSQRKERSDRGRERDSYVKIADKTPPTAHK